MSVKINFVDEKQFFDKNLIESRLTFIRYDLAQTLKISNDKIGLNDIKVISPDKNKYSSDYPPPIAYLARNNSIFIKVIYDTNHFSDSKDISYNECQGLKLLTDHVLLKNISPCFCFYYTDYSVRLHCSPFFEKNTPDRYYSLDIKDKVKVLITEGFDGSINLHKFIETFHHRLALNEKDYKDIILMLMITLAYCQDKWKLVHNDLHSENVFIINLKNPVNVEMKAVNGKTYYFRQIRFLPKITDLEFSIFETPENGYGRLKVNPIARKFMKYYCLNYSSSYDVFFFLRDLLYMKKLNQNTRDYILSIFSNKDFNYHDVSDSESDESGSTCSDSCHSNQGYDDDCVSDVTMYDTSDSECSSVADDDIPVDDELDSDDGLPSRLNVKHLEYFDSVLPSAKDIIEHDYFKDYLLDPQFTKKYTYGD